MKILRLVPIAAVLVTATILGCLGESRVSAYDDPVVGVASVRAGDTAPIGDASTARATASIRDPSGSVRSGSATEVDGGHVWMRTCAVCHGTDATGTPRGPNISKSGTAAIDFQVRTGRMPLDDAGQKPRRRDPALDPDEIEALIDHVSTFVTGPRAGDPPDGPTDLPRGGEAFVARCAACHQAAGSGGALPRGTTAPALDRADPREIAEAIRTGPGDMPRFPSTILDDSELADIVAYVGHLRDPGDRGGFDLGHLGPVTEGLVAVVIGLGAVLVHARWLGSRVERSGEANAGAGGNGSGGTGPSG